MELTDKFDDDIINEAMRYLPLTILRMCTINEEDDSCQKKYISKRKIIWFVI